MSEESVEKIEVKNSLIVKFTEESKLEDHKVFMSFGLLNTLASYVGDLSQLPNVMVDTDLQAAIVVACLGERNDEGEFETVETFHELSKDLNVDAALEILEWVVKHLTNFFMRAVESYARISLKAQENLAAGSTQSGTPA